MMVDIRQVKNNNSDFGWFQVIYWLIVECLITQFTIRTWDGFFAVNCVFFSYFYSHSPIYIKNINVLLSHRSSKYLWWPQNVLKRFGYNLY